MGEKQTSVEDLLVAANLKPEEAKVKLVTRKAKVLVVCLDERGMPGVFVATRSEHEDTRQLDPDFLGGKLGLKERPLNGLKREVDSEFPGLELLHTKRIGKVERRREVPHSVLTIVHKTTTYIYAANAICPPAGVVFGLNEDGVQEHCAASIHPREALPNIPGMPKKYPEAASSHIGQLILSELEETALPMNIPPELLETRWQTQELLLAG